MQVPSGHREEPRHARSLALKPMNQEFASDSPESFALGQGIVPHVDNIAKPSAAHDVLPGQLARPCQPVDQHHLDDVAQMAGKAQPGRPQLQPGPPAMLVTPLNPEEFNAAQIKGKTSQQAPEAAASLDLKQPGNFPARVAAALQSSSHIIANLTARLEAMVLLKSGASIQGHEACTAALRM